jgi:hypothetical protein
MHVVGIDAANAPHVSLTIIPPTRLHGTPLPQDAFAVHEVGELRPAQAERVDPASVEVAAVLDVAGADAARLRDLKGAAVEFLLGLPDRVRFSIVATTDLPDAAIPTDIATAIATIDDVESAAGGDLGSAITTATLGFTRAPGMAQHVVIFSAVSEPIGDQAMSEITRALQRESAVGHLIGWGSMDRARRLAAVPEATGGLAELVDGSTAISDAGARTAAGIANQYRVSYVSAENRGSTDVDLEIRHVGVEATASVAVLLPKSKTATTTVESAESAAVDPGAAGSSVDAVVITAIVVVLIGWTIAGLIVTVRRGTRSADPVEPRRGWT